MIIKTNISHMIIGIIEYRIMIIENFRILQCQLKTVKVILCQQNLSESYHSNSNYLKSYVHANLLKS